MEAYVVYSWEVRETARPSGRNHDMRLTYNSDDRTHAILGQEVPQDCYPDDVEVVYSDDFASATDLLNAMDTWSVAFAFPQCRDCRHAVLSAARGEEQFWLPQVAVAA